LLVSGPQAAARVAAVFQPANGRNFCDEPAGRIVFGRWGAAPGEEVVVCRRNDAQVEVHCHGGRIAAAEITQSLLNLGCRPRSWRNWLEHDEPDPIAAAARIALASAPTERTAAILLDQYHGALRRALDDLLVRLDRADASAASALDLLRARCPLGSHLTTPWQVVLAGRPNVGKSSLVNALLGYERAIVYGEPGTTRDVLSAGTALAGWPVELSDTAGLRPTADVLEAAGIDRANQRAASADLVLLVVDASQDRIGDNAALASAWPQALMIRNKCDLATAAGSQRQAGLPLRSVSAVTREGIDELAAEIARRLVPAPPPLGSAVPFTADQIRDVNESASLVARQKFAEAARLLRSRYSVRQNC
jgi:tRNA modification GTPase